MGQELRILRELRDQSEAINEIRELLTHLTLGGRPPRRLGPTEAIDERTEGMAHFIKNRQHMAPVPVPNDPNGLRVVKQELRVTEDGVEILPWTEVAFDPTTGEEQPPLPEFWAEVDKTVGREARYTYSDGTVTDPFAESYVQVDNYSPPTPAPQDLGEADQIDEVDADTRPS